MKDLTEDTRAIVDDLRRKKTAFEVLFGVDDGKPRVTYTIGQAISRLCLLDVTVERQRARIEALEAALERVSIGGINVEEAIGIARSVSGSPARPTGRSGMTVTFEPGDGSFDVVLDANEPFDPQWNIPAATVLRRVEAGVITLKKRGVVLEGAALADACTIHPPVRG